MIVFPIMISSFFDKALPVKACIRNPEFSQFENWWRNDFSPRDILAFSNVGARPITKACLAESLKLLTNLFLSLLSWNQSRILFHVFANSISDWIYYNKKCGLNLCNPQVSPNTYNYKQESPHRWCGFSHLPVAVPWNWRFWGLR